MPDIKTAMEVALSKTAQAWAADDEAHQQTETPPDARVTNNVSRITFNYVRDNPNTPRDVVAATLVAQGFKAVSVTSLLSQMVRARMMVLGDDNTLTTTIKEYEPIRPLRPVRQAKKSKAEPAPPAHKQVTLVNTRTGEVLNPKPAPQSDRPWNVTDQLNSMSIVQARELYDALRKIFGG